ncbi:MAG: hypothetical protein KF838_13355 [Phycisphaeraceae bacterium]|nr:MAG: hypothetical protein KF838_13355 [Phycisphaeraceae bacterium]
MGDLAEDGGARAVGDILVHLDAAVDRAGERLGSAKQDGNADERGDGPGVLVVARVEPREGRVAVYNLEVSRYHTYFVGNRGVWVHNSCWPEDQVVKKMKHAPHFGVSDSPTKANIASFISALEEHRRTATLITKGTYRGTIKGTHYYESTTGLWQFFDESDKFITGWKLYPSQIRTLLSDANVK